MPALLSSLTDASRDGLSAALAAEAPSRPCLRAWLREVPDPRSPLGRWHPLEFVLALAVCAFTAASGRIMINLAAAAAVTLCLVGHRHGE